MNNILKIFFIQNLILVFVYYFVRCVKAICGFGLIVAKK